MKELKRNIKLQLCDNYNYKHITIPQLNKFLELGVEHVYKFRKHLNGRVATEDKVSINTRNYYPIYRRIKSKRVKWNLPFEIFSFDK